MKTIHRVLAGCLAAVIMVPAVSTAAKAAEPGVSMDEAVYVNLDYYGKPEKVNVVKGCDLNGKNQFTDYGSYDGVTNMSNDAKPAVTGDSVSWNLPENTGRFYYECTPKSNAVTLPWDFDVSYKLNGVPFDAKKLAGASGTVEINIKAVPNKSADDYYKNNMLLMVGTYVKLKDTLSVEAPGAQLQSLGDYKAVLFSGLPGEEESFTVRIGTKSFESAGMVMMMVPGTLEQFNDIKDLKEDKDTIKDSMDAVSLSTNQILGTLESMSGGLSQTKAGLSALDGARGTISSSKGTVYANADKALADLSSITTQTAAVIPHLQNGEQLVQDVNTDMNAMNQTISAAGSDAISLSSAIERVRLDVSDLRDVLDNVDDLSGDRANLTQSLKTDLGTAQADLKALQPYIAQLNANSAQLTKDNAGLTQVLEYLSAVSGSGSAGTATDQAMAAIIKQTAPVLASLTKVMQSSNTIAGALGQISGQSDELFKTGNETVSVADSYFDALEDGGETADELLKDTNHIGSAMESTLGNAQKLIGNLTALNNTANQYKDGAVGALKDTEELARRLTNGLVSTQAFLTSLETIMKTSGEKLDDGTRKSLNGLIDVLQKSLDGLGATSTIKNANNTIHDTVNNEINKFENKNNFLNLDAQAKPVSFTSVRNASPSSIQIVLRTEEITKDEGNAGTADLEKAEDSTSVLDRMRNVFVKLWNAIASVFSK